MLRTGFAWIGALVCAALLAAGCSFDNSDDSAVEVGGGDQEPGFVDWPALANPILAEDDRMLKDPCVVLKDGVFYLFASVRFESDDPERYLKTPWFYKSIDLMTWEPFFDEDLRTGDYEYGDSPDVVESGGIYYMVFQREDPDRRNSQRLYYTTSLDLEDWTPPLALAPETNPGKRQGDGALGVFAESFFLGFKQGETFLVTRSTVGSVTGDWLAPLRASPGEPLGWAENYQFLRVDDRWRMVATARAPDSPLILDNPYTDSHEPYIYTMAGDGYLVEDWVLWIDKRQLNVPTEDWNQVMHANSGYLADWREYDGHYYLFYAGSNDGESFDRRGHGKIGVVRSTGLRDWLVAGEPDAIEE